MKYSILLTIYLCLTGCGIKLGIPPRENFVFNYEPKVVAPPMSSDTTFSLIVTRFFIPAPLFKNFVASIQGDTRDLLTSKGFVFAGQYDTYDRMTLMIKEATDLVLSVNVNFTINGSDVEWITYLVADKLQEELGFETKPEGTITIQGSVSLAIHESLTNELLSIKNISIKPISVEIPYMLTSFDITGDNYLFTSLMKNSNAFRSEVGTSMVVQYKTVMDTISDYLDAVDIKAVMRSAKEFRMRKVH